MKKLFSLILIGVLLSSTFSLAEEAHDAAWENDRETACGAIEAVVDMLGKAASLLESKTGAPNEESYLESFLRIPVLEPFRVIIVELSDEQIDAACRALKAEGTDGIAPAIADELNLSYSEAYARAAASCTQHRDYTNGPNRLALLPYQDHIAVFGPVNGKGISDASLIISTRKSSLNLNGEIITEYAARLGLYGLTVRVYEGSAMAELMNPAKWVYHERPTRRINTAIGENETLMKTLFPQLVRSGMDWLVLADLLNEYVLRHPNDLSVARKASANYLPLLLPLLPDGAISYLEHAWITFGNDDNHFEPRVAFSDTLQQAALPDEATVLILLRSETPKGAKASIYSENLMAMLPAKRIPDTPEAADYILLCDTTWPEVSLRSGDRELYAPNTRITLHDARTGQMINDLGTVVRKPNGYILVSSKITYWNINMNLLWTRIKKLFE